MIGIGSREEECVLGVQQWAEVRRLVLVEGRSQREVARRLGLARDTVAKAVASEAPPRYSRVSAGSKLDRFKGWICEQLREDPSISSQRLRELASELGYEGGKTIFDDYVREVRPRYRQRRTFQRTIYRPGELAQCDLWEPREPIPVGHGQTRRGWVVTAELCWSRVVAGALIFSKEAPDVLWGLGCGALRSRGSSSTTSTGEPGSSWSAARLADTTRCRCPTTSARRSVTTWCCVAGASPVACS